MQIVSLTQRAMLVRLKISQPTFTKHDKQASQDVARVHSSDASMGRFNKDLFAKEYLKDVQAAHSALREHHTKLTLPWKDDGWRVLPSEMFFKYQEQQRDLVTAYLDAADDLCSRLDEIKSDARHRLNGLYREEDYPTAEAFRACFAVAPDTQNIPSGDDFRVRLGDEADAMIRAQIDRGTSDATAAAMNDLFVRVREVVSHMAERLRAYTGKREGSFKDTLVENVREIAGLLPALNLTGDPRLAEITDRLINDLCREDAQTLRDRPFVRDAVAAEAEAILAKVDEFLA